MQVEGDFELHRFYFHGGLIMERMEALTNYYTTHNEDARLTSKHGMVEFLTTIHYICQNTSYHNILHRICTPAKER